MLYHLNQFDTIIFDFGGVILDINPQLSMDAFSRFSGKSFDSVLHESDLLGQFERGEIPATQLRSDLCQFLGIKLTVEEFDQAWNALLLEFHPERIRRIQELKSTHRLVMLSNTNEIHYPVFSQKLINEYGVSFNDLFQQVYLSYQMHLIKPDPAIFKRVLEQEQIDPAKTLLIEDSKENAESASSLGIHTLVIPRNGMFYDYLKF